MLPVAVISPPAVRVWGGSSWNEAAGDANKSTGEAAKNTWFVPNTPNWANVESGNVLQNMLESIATGKSSVADAAKSADTQIASILNSTS